MLPSIKTQVLCGLFLNSLSCLKFCQGLLHSDGLWVRPMCSVFRRCSEMPAPASVDGAAVGLGGSPHGASIWGALVLLIYPVCILTVIKGSVLIQIPEHSVFLGLLIEFSTLKEWQLDGFLLSKWFIHPKHLPELSTYRHLSVVMLQPGRLQWHAPVQL